MLFLSLNALIFSYNTIAEANERPERRGAPTFDVLDLNEDGAISLDEFKQHEIPHGSHFEIFQNIDTDGNNAISEQELSSHKPPQRDRRRKQR